MLVRLICNYHGRQPNQGAKTAKSHLPSEVLYFEVNSVSSVGLEASRLTSSDGWIAIGLLGGGPDWIGDACWLSLVR